MKKEFNLSDRELEELYYLKSDVKEFIRKVRKDTCCCEFIKPKKCPNCYALDFYAGDKLKEDLKK